MERGCQRNDRTLAGGRSKAEVLAALAELAAAADGDGGGGGAVAFTFDSIGQVPAEQPRLTHAGSKDQSDIYVCVSQAFIKRFFLCPT